MLTRENESVIKRIILVAAVGLLVSGCYMVPLAFIGPATSGFTTASIVQSAIATTANHMVKKTTGKTFSEHVMDTIDMDKVSLGYFPSNKSNNLILPLAKPL